MRQEERNEVGRQKKATIDTNISAKIGTQIYGIDWGSINKKTGVDELQSYTSSVP
jgi:hypothetical protein